MRRNCSRRSLATSCCIDLETSARYIGSCLVPHPPRTPDPRTMFDTMNLAILVASILVVVSIFTSLISFRVGAPLLLVFLLIGLGACEDGFGGIVYDEIGRAHV